MKGKGLEDGAAKKKKKDGTKTMFDATSIPTEFLTVPIPNSFRLQSAHCQVIALITATSRLTRETLNLFYLFIFYLFLFFYGNSISMQIMVIRVTVVLRRTV